MPLQPILYAEYLLFSPTVCRWLVMLAQVLVVLHMVAVSQAGDCNSHGRMPPFAVETAGAALPAGLQCVFPNLLPHAGGLGCPPTGHAPPSRARSAAGEQPWDRGLSSLPEGSKLLLPHKRLDLRAGSARHPGPHKPPWMPDGMAWRSTVRLSQSRPSVTMQAATVALAADVEPQGLEKGEGKDGPHTASEATTLPRASMQLPAAALSARVLRARSRGGQRGGALLPADSAELMSQPRGSAPVALAQLSTDPGVVQRSARSEGHPAGLPSQAGKQGSPYDPAVIHAFAAVDEGRVVGIAGPYRMRSSFRWVCCLVGVHMCVGA